MHKNAIYLFAKCGFKQKCLPMMTWEYNNVPQSIRRRSIISHSNDCSEKSMTRICGKPKGEGDLHQEHLKLKKIYTGKIFTHKCVHLNKKKIHLEKKTKKKKTQ